jgi:predicted metal-dependent hydrolase
MNAVEPDKKFYQGVLQIAVSLYHLGNLNWRGAAILLGEGMSRLGYYSPEYYSIDVEKLITESHQILLNLQESGPDNVAEFAQQLFTGDRLKRKDGIGRLKIPQIVKIV